MDQEAASLVEHYRVNARPPIFVIGTFDQRVTVLSQQIRALNLAWALIESKQLPTMEDDNSLRVAIIGGGFAGLTFAAALLQKRCNCNIALFEERDTLLPLQQGSDTRWLHPHIYDWPDEGSEAAAAMLPLLNWTAARASDVVVQALTSWKEMVRLSKCQPKVYCNTRHLQVSCHPEHPQKAQIEWVGEIRVAEDGTASRSEPHARGCSETFDIIVLAVGFGLEIDNHASYWRNETFGQPSLNQPRKTYLVSGQGDGAMIDLLRLRISQYRQDRILDELFEGKPELLDEIKKLRTEFLENEENSPLFQKFDQLRGGIAPIGEQFEKVVQGLERRLRRDTEVILKLRIRNIAELLDARTSRTSFQNSFLVYLLYLCGGFAPTAETEADILERFKIPPEQVIRRHGTKRLEQLKRLLSEELFASVETELNRGRPNQLKQTSAIRWDGGYFGQPGRKIDANKVSDQERVSWRKEYLPGPTAILASVLCGAVAGLVASLRSDVKQFRVTLHRSLPIGSEELLQQACEYSGPGTQVGQSTSGRTFPAKNATIGLAYRCRRIIRALRGVVPDCLQTVMAALNLDEASRKMAHDVCFVLAIPILQPDDKFFTSSPVVGVVYLDSKDLGFWLADEEVRHVVCLIEESIRSIQRPSIVPFDRIRNTSLRGLRQSLDEPDAMPEMAAGALEAVAGVEPPRTVAPFVLNFDHSDLTPITVSSGRTDEPSPVGASS